jgi:AraC-like DNA-binding protein
MNTHLIDSGILMGLSDLRLGKAIEGMHKHPETSWSLEQLAQRAGMSRARFAAYFRQVVGMTPFDYLTNWRLGVAQTMLRKGNSLKLIAAKPSDFDSQSRAMRFIGVLRSKCPRKEHVSRHVSRPRFAQRVCEREQRYMSRSTGMHNRSSTVVCLEKTFSMYPPNGFTRAVTTARNKTYAGYYGNPSGLLRSTLELMLLVTRAELRLMALMLVAIRFSDGCSFTEILRALTRQAVAKRVRLQ